MNTSLAAQEPQLAPPGAGLPLPELLIARLIFAWKRRSRDRAKFDRLFREERDAILAVVRPLSGDEASRRVLIPRLRGLEDSSRNWSVWMTLDHLRITNTVFASVMESLAKGIVPNRVASTAVVKPDPSVDGSVVAAFEQSCEAVLSVTNGQTASRTNARYAHPWFGPLDETAWHAMTGFHMKLHRRQIERILEGVGPR
ncbi:MAG: DinB family protein [Prosthecobacter sp.]